MSLDLYDVLETTCARCRETVEDATDCDLCGDSSCACDRTVDCDTGLTFCKACVRRCLCRECAS